MRTVAQLAASIGGDAPGSVAGTNDAVASGVEGRRLLVLALTASFGGALAGCYVHHERRNPPSPPADDVARDAGLDASEASTSGDPRPSDSGVPVGTDGGGDPPPPREVACEAPQGVDLLLVMDDSGSIRLMDEAIRDSLRRMLYELVRPLDADGDGWEDWARVTDLQVGVVTTSATGPRFCAHAADGALMRGTPATLPYCRDSPYPAITRFEEDDSVSRLLDDVACVAFGPRDGCQVEQPLEAMAKALLPNAAPFDFVTGRARGDRENAGFLRRDSVLVVLVFANEDDCSIADPSAFDPPDAGPPQDAGRVVPPFFDAGAPPGTFVCEAPDEGDLHDVERYLEILRWLRPDPRRLVFGAVSGIDEFVDDPRPGERYGRCRRGAGYPTRLVELAQGLEGRALLSSLCDIREARMVRGIAERIAHAACAD